MVSGEDLFGWVDPRKLVRGGDPGTAQEAAWALDPETGNWRVAKCLYEVGELTTGEMDEVYAGWGWENHDGEPHKRVDTLRKLGWVEDTGKVRESRKTGRRQIVWALTEWGRLRMGALLGDAGVDW